jgi:hypothetical protein
MYGLFYECKFLTIEKNNNKIEVNSNNYIFTLLHTIEIIIVCFIIPHFQLLLLCVVISVYGIWK